MLRSLRRDRYVQSATYTQVAFVALGVLGSLRSLRSDRYVHIGCVALHALHLLRCVRCIRIVTYTSVALRCMRCVRCVETDIYRSQRTHRLRCIRCVGCVCFVTFSSSRTHRLHCVACVGCIRIVTYRADPFRCVRLRLSTTPARSVKDCQKKLNVFCVTTDGQNTRFLRFFAFFGAQKPRSGVEIFSKKKFFFLRFFDFLLRCWPVLPTRQEILVARQSATCRAVAPKKNFFFRHHKNFHQKKKNFFFLGVGDFGKKNPKKKIQKKPSQTVQ